MDADMAHDAAATRLPKPSTIISAVLSNNLYANVGHILEGIMSPIQCS